MAQGLCFHTRVTGECPCDGIVDPRRRLRSWSCHWLAGCRGVGVQRYAVQIMPEMLLSKTLSCTAILLIFQINKQGHQ